MPSGSLDSHPALLTGPGIDVLRNWTRASPYLQVRIPSHYSVKRERFRFGDVLSP